jgi:hypothetical protein
VRRWGVVGRPRKRPDRLITYHWTPYSLSASSLSRGCYELPRWRQQHGAMSNRKLYPSDVSDEEWAFVAPYLTLVRERMPPNVPTTLERSSTPCEVDRACGCFLADALPHDFPPWEAVYQQTRRWIALPGPSRRWSTTSEPCCALGLHSHARPFTAVILDSPTLRSSPESGHTAPATTGPSPRRVRRCMRPLTL